MVLGSSGFISLLQKTVLYVTLYFKIFILYMNPFGTSFYSYEDRQGRERISFKSHERHLEKPIRLSAVSSEQRFVYMCVFINELKMKRRELVLENTRQIQVKLADFLSPGCVYVCVQCSTNNDNLLQGKCKSRLLSNSSFPAGFLQILLAFPYQRK